ncbi:hypothetical protein [Pseudomonas agarici]|uniref:hypothetical protein n=1 Tax=Pseudomonas agarici TaxID=46677 RepID=UPI000375D889|nr:hypothetical protein [Pseudomonas agarici]NWB92640.1 hypothetical protein [Pseudomonas agarici]NWC07532.1 hypothetical protein [Pseudomonas agarici]SEL07933.1 hypothetical protein SAMN05216604_110148 [Pseudomonas agarici]
MVRVPPSTGYYNTPVNSDAQEGSSSHAGESLESKARAVYENERRFHGTDAHSASSIKNDGFKSGKKTAYTDADATPHHFITGDKNVARSFASTHGLQAALIRTLGAHTNKHAKFERDPFMRDPTTLRTKYDIKPKHVLGGKGRASGDNAEVFRKRLDDAGIKVGKSEAKRLLNEVESDSDNDF